MKFAAYVVWILLYKCCKFGEKICNNSRDIEFFLGDYFFLARPVYQGCRALPFALAGLSCNFFVAILLFSANSVKTVE